MAQVVPPQMYGAHMVVPVTPHEPAVQVRLVCVPAAQLGWQPLPGPPFWMVHTPGMVPLHVLHVAHDGAAQQTVSTHWLVAHWLGAPHGCPLASLHMPAPSHAWPAPEHMLPGPSAWLAQVPLPLTLHALHVLHEEALQHTPSTQLPLAH